LWDHPSRNGDFSFEMATEIWVFGLHNQFTYQAGDLYAEKKEHHDIRFVRWGALGSRHSYDGIVRIGYGVGSQATRLPCNRREQCKATALADRPEQGREDNEESVDEIYGSRV
jgi:hypothetical protein